MRPTGDFGCRRRRKTLRLWRRATRTGGVADVGSCRRNAASLGHAIGVRELHLLVESGWARGVHDIGKGRRGSCRPLDAKNELSPIAQVPAATGPFYLKLTLGHRAGDRGQGPRLTVHRQNDQAPLFTVADVQLPDLGALNYPKYLSHLNPEGRLFLLPVVDALVTVPSSMDQLVVQQFDVREELEKVNSDYFVVLSNPPTRFKRGEKLSYPIDVLSKLGQARFELESGPPQMTISVDGMLIWDVPADMSLGEVVAVVKIRDASGQELIHTIKLNEDRPKGTEAVTYSFAARSEPIRSEDPPLATAPPATAPPVTVPPVTVPPAIRVPSIKPSAETQSPDLRHAPPAHSKFLHDRHATRGPTAKISALERSESNLRSRRTRESRRNSVGRQTPVARCRRRAHFRGCAAAGALRVRRFATWTSDRLWPRSRRESKILDRSGKEIRRVLLENVPPTACVLHPHKPICYVSLDRELADVRGVFVAVDESTGTVSGSEERFGQEAGGRSVRSFPWWRRVLQIDLCWRPTDDCTGQFGGKSVRSSAAATAGASGRRGPADPARRDLVVPFLRGQATFPRDPVTSFQCDLVRLTEGATAGRRRQAGVSALAFAIRMPTSYSHWFTT